MNKSAKFSSVPFFSNMSIVGPEYHWIQGTAGDGLETYFLVAQHGTPIHKMDVIDSQTDKVIFQKFADIGTDAVKLLDFANTYGLLGREEVFLDSMESASSFGEDLRFWSGCIVEMGFYIELWQAIVNDDFVNDDFDSMVKLIRSENAQHFSSDDPARFPDFATQREEAMKSRDELCYFVKTMLGSKIQNRIAKSVTLGFSILDFQISMVSKQLFSAIWIQFAFAVSNATKIGRCVVCGDPFPVGGQNSREDKTYCSGRCRVRKNYDQKRVKKIPVTNR
jgi:predicted nucleic acid-binding Zn ribbon protein